MFKKDLKCSSFNLKILNVYKYRNHVRVKKLTPSILQFLHINKLENYVKLFILKI